MASTKQKNSHTREAGFASLVIIVFILIFFCIYFFLFITLSIQAKSFNSTFELNSKKDASSNTNSVDNNSETNSTPNNKQITIAESTRSQDIDVFGVELVCVNAPGINPTRRTPALDRRVAQRLLNVRQEMDELGLNPLRFTYMFRSTCEQYSVRSSTGVKAKPGSSPHEAGRAIDIADMSPDKGRSDRRTVHQILLKNGFISLANIGDYPHYHIDSYKLGFRSHQEMIRSAQEQFKQGTPKLCRGSESTNCL